MLPAVGLTTSWPFNLTLVYAALLGVVAFGLSRPFSPRRALIAAALGLVLGFLATYFNVYPGSIRGALALLAIALFVSGMRWGGRFVDSPEPLVPRPAWIAAGIGILLVGASLFPYTKAGADSVDEPIYLGLQRHQIQDAAPALPSPADVRVVSWDLASEIVKRGYGGDASYLDTSDAFVFRSTYPDTVRGEFVWVHAPAPTTSKWMFGGQTANKIVYVRNNQTDLEPKTVSPGTPLAIHTDGRYWDDRVARYAMEHGEFRWVLQDTALQLDDSDVPHWIAYLARIDIKNQPHLERLIVINAHTGAETDMAIGDVAAQAPWIEMVYPESYVYYWANYWGANREGIVYRWFTGDKLMEPDDVTVRYIVLEGKTYWLLPMRQLNSPNLGGYILVDTRTGDARFFDRFDDNLVDYETAVSQVRALELGGEAASQLSGDPSNRASLSYLVDEGYLYPVKMRDNTTRDAWIFPLRQKLDIAAFAIIDAQHFNNQTAFAYTISEAVARFAATAEGAAVAPPDEAPTNATMMRVLEGVRDGDDVLVNLDGTWYRVTNADLALGERREAAKERGELLIAIQRVERGDEVEAEVRLAGGHVVDFTLPGVQFA